MNFGKFISELYNPFMTSRSFPDTCKVAKLMLTFAKTDPSIYRPISLMLLLSKVFVRIVLDQANDLFNLNKILYDYQSGFSKNHSTDTSDLQIKHSFLDGKALKGFDDALLSGIILIDLDKVFNMINYKILLRRLSIIDFSDDVVKQFEPYLSNR